MEEGTDCDDVYYFLYFGHDGVFTDERDQNWRFIDNLKFERLKLVLFLKT